MIGKSYDTKQKNIDNFIDMIVSAQEENGIKPTMTEALYDPTTKERINVFKRKQLEEQGVDMEEYGLSSPCGSCKKKEEKHISNIERGIFVYSENDLIDDDEDGEYVCEYCTKIGFNSTYKPDICDTCDDCEGCVEYMNGECDGCQYSATFNCGSSYGQINEIDSVINSEDAELIDEIEEGGPDYDVEKPDGGFTIMNY